MACCLLSRSVFSDPSLRFALVCLWLVQFVWAFTLVLWIREQGPRSTRSQAKLWPHWEGWERLLLSSPFRFFLPLRSANSRWHSGFSGCPSAVQMWLQHGYKQCQVTDFWSAPINAAFSPLKFHYSVNLKCPPSDVAVWGEASLAGRVYGHYRWAVESLASSSVPEWLCPCCADMVTAATPTSLHYVPPPRMDWDILKV